MTGVLRSGRRWIVTAAPAAPPPNQPAMPVDFSGWGDGPLPRGVGLRVADTNGSAEELANHLIVTNPGVAVRDWCWAGEWLTAGLGAADEDQLTWLNEYHAALAEFVEPRGYRHLVDLLGAPE